LVPSKERAFYKATRQALTAVNLRVPLKNKLSSLARILARSFDAGASVLLFDSAGTRLVHAASWKLPPAYIHKGLLMADRGLAETTAGGPVFFSGEELFFHLEYPEQARKAGITAIIGVPINKDGNKLGAIRVYFREHWQPSSQDLSYLNAMAKITAVAISCPFENKRDEQAPEVQATVERKAVKFAHSSESEFASILDFYGIDWIYEPKSFALGERQMFTPDFYLPALDQYIELTTMKQNLVTLKNRKLRKLKELYPSIKISLLYKKDYDRLLAKYGAGPLAQSSAHGLKQVLFSASEIEKRVIELAGQISEDYTGKRPVLIGVQRGFICFMADLIRRITVPLDLDFMTISYYGQGQEGVRVIKDIELPLTGRHIILVEDIIDTGITLDYLLRHLNARCPESLKICVLLDRRARRLVDLKLDYVAFDVPDEFVVGYGLDYHEEYRNLPFIAVPEIAEFDTNSRA
jgi:bifunctional protein TilS/HprT